MKRIILLRHGKTEPYGYEKPDFERNLTVRGIADCELIAHKLKSKGYQMEKIVASPANRTVQTSELFAKSFGISTSEILYNEQIYNGMTTQDMLNFVAKTSDEVETVLFVGHNPDIARFAYSLTTDFAHNVPTCCAIILETPISSWEELGNKEFAFTDIFIPKKIR